MIAKDRPCGVILTRITKAGTTAASVLPITHTPPLKDEDGIEIPQATKRRLGPDTERSWIITTELNQFAWQSFDRVHNAVKAACGTDALRCLRADSIWDEAEVIQDISSLTYRSRIVVA